MSKHNRQVGPRYEHHRTEFWAEDGMVCWEDKDTGQFSVMTQSEARHRFYSIGKAWLRMDKWSVSDTRFKDLRPDVRNLLLDMESVLQDAHNQGDPTAQVVQQAQERAEFRSAFMDAAQPVPAHAMSAVHMGEALPRVIPVDKRAKVSRTGKIWLPHGLGTKHERKYY